MKRLAALLAFLACAPGVFAGGSREAPLSLPTLSLTGTGVSVPKTPAGLGVQLPDIPTLPGSAVQALSGASAQTTALKASQLSVLQSPRQASQAVTLQAAQPGAAAGEAAPLGLQAAQPAEQVAHAVQAQNGDPQAASAAAFDGFVKRGFELEYAVKDGPRTRAEILPASAYAGALGYAAKRFALKKAVSAKDDKHGLGHHKAYADDEDGRQWKAVPEEVGGVKYDGVELITPPLTSKGEVEKLALVHEDALAGAVLVRGMSSSLHATYDVSHLVTEDGDASRLVDAILFIENNWTKVYAAASPSRYGTIVNRFSTPLGVDHPELLEQLAAMPRAERTLENVRALFWRFHDKELARWGGHPGKAWKMRAANYGKIMGTQAGYEETPLSVIEFRIADLPDAAFLPKLSDLFAALVTRAPPQDAYASPFPGKTLPDHNAAVARQDRSEYAAFLETLDLPRADYPFLATHGMKEEPSIYDVAHAAFQAALKRTPLTARFAVASLQAGDRRTLLAGVKEFLRSGDEAVREAAAELLMENVGDMPPWELLYAVAEDASEDVRFQLGPALMSLDGPTAAPLVAKLLGDSSPATRSWAWAALGRHTSAETVELLRQLLAHDDATVREAAEKTLDLRSDEAALSLRQERLRAAIEAEKKMLSSTR